jgi:hypothetical protein
MTPHSEVIKDLARWLGTKEPYRSGKLDAEADAASMYLRTVNDPKQFVAMHFEKAMRLNEYDRKLHAIRVISSDGAGMFEAPISLATAEWILGPLEVPAKVVKELVDALTNLVNDWERVHGAIPLDHEAKAVLAKLEGGAK